MLLNYFNNIHPCSKKHQIVMESEKNCLEKAKLLKLQLKKTQRQLDIYRQNTVEIPSTEEKLYL